MRTTHALGLTLLTGILTACGAPAGDGPRGTPAGEASSGSFHTQIVIGDVRLSAGRTLDDGALVVDYVLHNAGDEAFLVHDRLPPTLGSAALPGRVDPERTWVFMVGSRIRVSKQGFDPGPDVRFIAPPVVGARILEPGGQLSGRARLGLPVELDVPGPEFAAPRSPVDASASEFEFCVQLTKGEGHPSAAAPDIVEVPSAAPRSGELLCSQALDLPS